MSAIFLNSTQYAGGGGGGSSLPTGGTTGQVLTKQSSADGDADWETPSGGSGIPSGGTTGQVLTKHSAIDGDVEWTTPPSGSSGHIIQNSSGTDMTARDTLQFVGATVTDDSTNGKTVVEIDLSNYYTKSETVTQINNAIGAALLASY